MPSSERERVTNKNVEKKKRQKKQQRVKETALNMIINVEKKMIKTLEKKEAANGAERNTNFEMS